MKSSCIYCNGIGYINCFEPGSSGFDRSATSIQKCQCQRGHPIVKNTSSGRTAQDMERKLPRSSELAEFDSWLVRIKARWQLRGRIAVDANGNIWRGFHLFHRLADRGGG